MFGYALLRASYSGAILRQGPQNSAQKSTTAGLNRDFKYLPRTLFYCYIIVITLTLFQGFSENALVNQY